MFGSQSASFEKTKHAPPQERKTITLPKHLRMTNRDTPVVASVLAPSHAFSKTLCVFLSRCWRVLRSWTTACCWVCTSWTRETAVIRTSRREGTERDLWPSECSTPPPWSPFRGTARRPRPSPPTTREWAQLGGEVGMRGGGGGVRAQIMHTYLGMHTLCFCLPPGPPPFFSLSEARLHNRDLSLRGDSRTAISMATHKHTAATVCIYREGFKCKCSQRSSPTNICQAVSEQRRYLNSVSSNEEEEDKGGGEAQQFSDVLCVLYCVFRMGGIPAKTHKEEKLLIYLGIIDILQSYRYC